MRQAACRGLSRAAAREPLVARSLATSVAVVHPPEQSVRPSALPGDPSHTEKWLQASAARDYARTALC
jgi:hypothetical protein